MNRRSFLAAGAGAAGAMVAGGGTIGYALRRINRVGAYSPDALAALRAGEQPLLFTRYPVLKRTVPWLPLGMRSTPVEPLEYALAPTTRLFVKRDDLKSGVYGGNKARKLEYVLGDAQLDGAGTLVTIGSIGSNHGLATALYGRALGVRVELALFRQPVTNNVRRNLGGLLHAGASLRYAGSVAGALLGARSAFRTAERAGEHPYFVMAGGSSRLGTVGYIDAALELGEQVRRGEVPEPDRIFVALGTCGTAAGLVAGARLAGLRSRITCVRVADAIAANRYTVRILANDALDYLRARDPSIPAGRVTTDDFDVVGSFYGGYGVATDVSNAAVRWAAPRLALETTYTGKALAACLEYCRGAGAGETVLFWNTFNSAPVPQAESLDALPAALRRLIAASPDPSRRQSSDAEPARTA